jgi:hypothetical protein
MHTPSAKPGRTLGPGASLKSSHQKLICHPERAPNTDLSSRASAEY